jgi:hypothetical protein
MYIGLRVKHFSFLSDFNNKFSRLIFEKSSNIKFHENPSSGSRVVTYGKEGQTVVPKVIVSFRNSANVPTKKRVYPLI